VLGAVESRSLARSGVDLSRVLTAPPAPLGTTSEEVGSEESAEAAGAIDRVRGIARGARAALLAERRALRSLDPGLALHLRALATEVEEDIERLCRRADRMRSNRAGGLERHERRLDSWIRPLGQPQDRVLTAFQMVARFGRGWIDDLLPAIEPLPPDLLVLRPEQRPDKGGRAL